MYFDAKQSNVSSIIFEKLKRDFFAQMPLDKEFNPNEFVHEIIRENLESQDKIIALNHIDYKSKPSFITRRPIKYLEKNIKDSVFYYDDLLIGSGTIDEVYKDNKRIL